MPEDIAGQTTRRGLMAGAAAAGARAALPVSAGQDGKLYEIEIRNFRFNPARLEVRPGDRIRWTNRDRAPHDATGDDRSWNTAILRRGKSGELTVTAAMNGGYFCSVHPQMKASLVVVSV